MKIYSDASKDVRTRVTALVKKYYPELLKVGLKIDLQFVTSDDEEPALSVGGGYPAKAIIRKIPARDRHMGLGDCRIEIDEDIYEGMNDAERDALLDHELYHLELVLDKNRKPKPDGAGRPKLALKLHDRQFGWFDAIARRHGAASTEVQQAKQLIHETGQMYFQLDENVEPIATGAGRTRESAAAR
jgi:hypothetical protein